MSPVLEPNPQNGRKKLGLVLGAFLAVTVIISVIATIASRNPVPRGGRVGLTPPPLGGQAQGEVGCAPDGKRRPGSIDS